jgi:hypothetical protein
MYDFIQIDAKRFVTATNPVGCIAKSVRSNNAFSFSPGIIVQNSTTLLPEWKEALKSELRTKQLSFR